MAVDEEEESLIAGTGHSVLRHFPRRQTPRRRACLSILSLLKDVLLLLLAIPAVVSVLQKVPIRDLVETHHHSHMEEADPPKPTSCDCGGNTKEAKALGCKYDSLAAAWLPEHCRDDELTAEFERSGDGPNGTWLYWADTKHTQVLTLDEVAVMADQPGMKFHMSNHWHVVHCIFYWRKEHRFRFNGKIVEPRSDNEAHIKHCGELILNPAYGTIAGVALNTDHGHNG